MIRLVVANVADRGQAIRQAIRQGHAEYAVFNECRGTGLATIAQLVRHGVWKAYTPHGSQNVHVWREGAVGVVARGRRVLVAGGHLGAGKVKRDRRRRGPTRDETHQVIYDLENRGLVTLIGLHLPAKGTTTARWRMPLVLAALVRARVSANALRLRYPGAGQVMVGDGNLPALGTWRMGKSWKNLRTPSDFGRRHYTQVYYRGPVTVRFVREVHTASDHDALVLDVEPTGQAARFGGTL